MSVDNDEGREDMDLTVSIKVEGVVVSTKVEDKLDAD